MKIFNLLTIKLHSNCALAILKIRKNEYEFADQVKQIIYVN